MRQGDLVITASGSGTLIPADDVSLGFTSGGVLTEVLVEVGDQVKEGDVLARQDDLDAHQALVAVELQVAQASRSLTFPRAIRRSAAFPVGQRGAADEQPAT